MTQTPPPPHTHTHMNSTPMQWWNYSEIHKSFLALNVYPAQGRYCNTPKSNTVRTVRLFCAVLHLTLATAVDYSRVCLHFQHSVRIKTTPLTFEWTLWFPPLQSGWWLQTPTHHWGAENKCTHIMQRETLEDNFQAPGTRQGVLALASWVSMSCLQ